MCLHGKSDIREAVMRFQDSSVYGVVWIDNSAGTPLYGWDCIDFKNGQKVANIVRDLNQWHPDALQDGGSINLSDINVKRVIAGLDCISVDRLPKATGRASASSDSVAMQAG